MINSYSANCAGTVNSCFCIGPQGTEPLCPCAMRSVKVLNGRYIIDLGPIKPKEAIDYYTAAKCRHDFSPAYKCPQCQAELKYED
jgi:hypothetical protein